MSIRKKCLTWFDEFDIHFEVVCEQTKLELTPLIIDSVIMGFISIIFLKKTLKIYLLFMLTVQSLTVGFHLYVIVEMILLWMHAAHSKSEGFKDVVSKCKYTNRIFLIKLTIHSFCTILFITFTCISFYILNTRTKKRNTRTKKRKSKRNSFRLRKRVTRGYSEASSRRGSSDRGSLDSNLS